MNQNSRSLSSYINNNYKNLNGVTNSIMSVSSATITNNFGMTTLRYNNQFNTLVDSLNVKRIELEQTLHEHLSQNPNYIGSRNAGVKLAWQYEKADIEMGGTGSANWTKDEREQIINSKTGTVRGAEGHHQKNVVDHPEHQVNPDNIKFYKTKQEHLKDGHSGNFQNESDKPFIDKRKMLERTNQKRILLNEIKGITVSAAVGFGVALTISAIAEIATMGIETVEIEKLISNSLKAGIEEGIISSIVYCCGRMSSIFLQNQGIDLLTKIGALINYVSVGIISIGLVSIIQCIKMKINGIKKSEIFMQVGKNALFSTSVLLVSVIAQGIYGGYAGIIVSTSVGLIVVSANMVNSVHKRQISNKIKEFAIEECKPIIKGNEIYELY